MVSVQSLHSLLWKKKGEEKDAGGVEATAFWSSYSTGVSGHLCTLPVSKPLIGMSCSAQLPHPHLLVLVSYLPKLGTFIQLPPQNAASQGNAFRADCTNFCEGGLHPHPALQQAPGYLHKSAPVRY